MHWRGSFLDPGYSSSGWFCKCQRQTYSWDAQWKWKILGPKHLGRGGGETSREIDTQLVDGSGSALIWVSSPTKPFPIFSGNRKDQLPFLQWLSLSPQSENCPIQTPASSELTKFFRNFVMWCVWVLFKQRSKNTRKRLQNKVGSWYCKDVSPAGTVWGDQSGISSKQTPKCD